MADIDKSLPNEIRTQIEIPDSGEEVQLQEEITEKGPVEITQEEDGGATIDFDPSSVNNPGSTSHFDNLADLLPKDVLDPLGSVLKENYMDYKMSRKDWEQSYIRRIGFIRI
jgi:hypothetical protein